MEIKFNAFRPIEIPDLLNNERNDKATSSPNNSVDLHLETSSANSLHVIEGQMRKLQLLQKLPFETGVSNIKTINVGFAASTNIVGIDDEFLKETQRIIDNYRRQIKPSEIKGSQPVQGGKTPGHSDAKHGVKPNVQAEIMNKPDRIFSGINKNGRYVDIYHKNESVVITEFGNKERVISAYGKASTKGKNTPFNIEKIANDTRYVEIKLEKTGSTNVVYPNQARFNKNDFPPEPTKPNSQTKTNGGLNTGGATTKEPIVINPSGQKVSGTGEPLVTPKSTVANEPLPITKSQTVNENLPAPKPLGSLTKNISRGFVILQLAQLGLAVLNYSQLEADSQKFGYYIDPFFDKYIITDPDKAAASLPEGFELDFFTDPNDHASVGRSIKFTVKDGKFFNPDGYSLILNKEKGYVEAVLIA